MPLSIRKNDKVIILKGKDRGKIGKVLRMDKKKEKVYVEGVNIVKRFVRKTRKNPQGGSIEKESPVALSNVALNDDALKKGVRFKTNVLEDGSKNRQSVKSEKIFE